MTVLNRFRLDGRVAVVTGASSGLGVAFAQALAQAGADVALGARRADGLKRTQELVAREGRHALPVETDVTRPEDAARLIEQTVQNLGRVDILVNNAGISRAEPALREHPDAFRGVLEVNLEGAYWMAQAAARAMGDGGSIVNVASILGITTSGLPLAAYAASKAGLIGLTRDLAQQWTGRRGVRVNALAPGWFRSEMTDELPEGFLADVEKRAPAGRLGEAEELAAALVFLASDASGYVTGQTLVVDGGLTIT